MRLLLLLTVLLVSQNLFSQNRIEPLSQGSIQTDTFHITDSPRNRRIPLAIIFSKNQVIKNRQLIILSHGYNHNQEGSYLGYTYLTHFLASHGYTIVSIQHELPTDSIMPTAGIPQVVRLSNWKRGAENILAVIHALKSHSISIDFDNITLIGHSNGGDISMLFAHLHPHLIFKIISLDSRRVAFPRRYQPSIYSLRSSDQKADSGVLPTDEEIAHYQMKIIPLLHTTHNDMSNPPTEHQKDEINQWILRFLSKLK